MLTIVNKKPVALLLAFFIHLGSVDLSVYSSVALEKDGNRGA